MLELRRGNYLLVYKFLRCLHKVTIQMYTKDNELPHPLDGIAQSVPILPLFLCEWISHSFVSVPFICFITAFHLFLLEEYNKLHHLSLPFSPIKPFYTSLLLSFKFTASEIQKYLTSNFLTLDFKNCVISPILIVPRKMIN